MFYIIHTDGVSFKLVYYILQEFGERPELKNLVVVDLYLMVAAFTDKFFYFNYGISYIFKRLPPSILMAVALNCFADFNLENRRPRACDRVSPRHRARLLIGPF